MDNKQIQDLYELQAKNDLETYPANTFAGRLKVRRWLSGLATQSERDTDAYQVFKRRVENGRAQEEFPDVFADQSITYKIFEDHLHQEPPAMKLEDSGIYKAIQAEQEPMSMKTGRRLWAFGLVITVGLLLSDIVLAVNTSSVAPTMINVLYGLVAVWLVILYILVSIWCAFHWKGFFGE